MQIPGVTDLLKPEFFTSLSGGRTAASTPAAGADQLNRSSVADSTSLTFVPQLVLPALSYAEFQQFLLNGQRNFENVSFPKTGAGWQIAQQQVITNMMETWAKSIDELNRYLERSRNSSFQKLLDFINFQVTKGKIPVPLAYSGVFTLISYLNSLNPDVEPLSGAWNQLLPFIDKRIRGELTPFVIWNSLQLPYQFALIQPALTAQLLIEKAGLSPMEAMAKGYAYTIYTQINLPVFEALLKQYLVKLVPNMTLPELSNTVAKVKLAYLLCALAMLYKAETGGGTPEEIRAMLKGEMKLPQEGLLSTFVRLIQLELDKIPENERKPVLDALVNYVGSDPSFKDLLAPATGLEDSWSKETAPTVNSMLDPIG